jgi:hypothetical protein
MHFKTILDALRQNSSKTLVADFALTLNHNETLVCQRPRLRGRRLAVGLVAIAVLTGGLASQAAPFPPGPSKTAGVIMPGAAPTPVAVAGIIVHDSAPTAEPDFNPQPDPPGFNPQPDPPGISE